jgi:FlaA1/EpsC-like NDP-sugar epimerase
MEAIGGYLTNRVVLVTGAGGSIGSELCRQIVRFSPETVVLFDASESALYAIQMELKHRVGYLKYKTILGSVQNHRLTDAVFSAFKPHVVFHAAAYKHVPMLERNPWESIFNNILGTRTVIEKAIFHGAERVVMVSTDKAVRPTNVMGASKRMGEMVLQAYQGTGTRLMAVRFGNVVGSSGSVIPLFRSQIARGGPVTITHPEVTRYFMTIPEACQLILEAGALGTGDEIFILEMGTPVKIADMARDLIRLSGKEPGRDIEIIFTGLRAGEKLYEELITEDEGVVETQHKKIMVLRTTHLWNGYGDQDGYRRWLMDGIEELVGLGQRHDGCGIRAKLGEMIPEYRAGDSECVL